MQYSSSSSSRKFSAVFVNSLHKATLQIFYYTTRTAPRAQSHRKPQWNLTCESSHLGRFTRLCYTMLRFSMNREFLILTRKSKAKVSIVFNYITLFLVMTHGRVCVDFEPTVFPVRPSHSISEYLLFAWKKALLAWHLNESNTVFHWLKRPFCLL